MASLGDAEAARNSALRRLAKAGVHAVGVERSSEDADDESYIVVAHADPGTSLKVPKYLLVESRGRRIRVPVRLIHSERYQLG
jgi:hypothetical protein